MRPVTTPNPGQQGSRKMAAGFGPSLRPVRYRCDEDRDERLKTLESVVQRHSRAGPRGVRKRGGEAARLGVGSTKGGWLK